MNNGVFLCKHRRRYSRERAFQSLEVIQVIYSFAALGACPRRAAAAGEREDARADPDRGEDPGLQRRAPAYRAEQRGHAPRENGWNSPDLDRTSFLTWLPFLAYF